MPIRFCLDRRVLLGGALSGLALRGTSLGAQAAGQPGQPVRIPVRLEGSRVLVDCTINGQGPWPFVLDTGGTIGLIDLGVAKGLGLDYQGSSRLRLSIGHEAYPVYGAKELGFGGVVMQKGASFAGVEEFRFGHGAVGSLAAGVLSTMTAELDLADGEWRIYREGEPDRSGWTRYEQGIVAGANINGSSFIMADMTIAGQGARVVLDTGMPEALRLYRDKARELGIWDAPAWTPHGPDGSTRFMRVPGLQLAGIDLKGLLVSVFAREQWKLAREGIVGLPVLRHFDLATAPHEKAVFLRLNPRSRGAGQRGYNRAGLWVDRRGNDARVAVVGPQSPAAALGLAPGDTLVGVDFDSLVKRFYAPAGTRIPLVVERDGQRRDETLVLADFL